MINPVKTISKTKKNKSKALNLNNNKILEIKEVDGAAFVNESFLS